MARSNPLTPRPLRGRLLVVDDETLVMTALCNTLTEEGFETVGFSNAAEALDALQRQEFDLLITDMQMSQMDGMDLLREARAADPDLVAIMMTGHATIETAVEAMKLGAFDFVQKPLKLRSLLPVLTRALEVRRLRQENLQLRETVGTYELSVAIGFTLDADTILNKVLDAVLEQFGADEVSILLPTADGKELYVAAARGPRREQILNQRLAVGEGINGWVVRNQEPLILNGAVNDPRFTPNHPRQDIHAAISLPMMVGGQCVGVLNVNATKRRRPFTSGQMKALTVLSGTAAPALQAAALLNRLRDSEQRQREITENLPLVLWMLNGDASQALYTNPAYEKVWDRTCQSFYADAASWMESVHPDDRAASMAALQQATLGKRVAWSFRLKRPDGSIRFIEADGFPITGADGKVERIVGHAEDVSERKRLEGQLQQAQKMEAFGQLAGGVAHDFNNLLTIITGYCEMILNGAVPAEKLPDLIREIRKAGDRASALTRQLLAFSRKQLLRPVELDLNLLVTDIQKMLRRLIGEDIDLLTSLDPTLEYVKADPGQIEQVILNLVVNARDAMPTGGHLTIETRNVELDQAYALKHPEVAPGKYVMLAVSDTGCGMDEETRPRIFEPFFTTKGVGKGTGLGLATVHGIVKQSGASIEVCSELGRGTTLKIYLPRIKTSLALGTTWPVPSRIPQGRETILLAEDEEGVRATIRFALESNGYTVLTAANGEEALQVCRQHVGPIQLLLTDVVMPKMSGRQLADLVLAERPNVKALYLSGYTDDAIVRHGVMETGMAFLQKPFSPMVLAQKVRELLDSPPCKTQQTPPTSILTSGNGTSGKAWLGEAHGHGELVLVVDDESGVREILKKILESQGFRVLTVEDGTEAVAQFAAHQGEIVAALTDMVMPHMDGAATIAALRRINPQLRIIAMSGRISEAEIPKAAGNLPQVFLRKPFSKERLVTALCDVLHAGESEASPMSPTLCCTE